VHPQVRRPPGLPPGRFLGRVHPLRQRLPVLRPVLPPWAHPGEARGVVAAEVAVAAHR